MSDRCLNCGEFVFRSLPHRCEPTWYARLDWHEKGDEVKVHARDSEKAAEVFCEKHDAQGDYHIARNGDAWVIVYDKDMKLAGVYEIEVETLPTYYSTPVRLSDEERKALAHEEEESEEDDWQEEGASE